MRRSSVLVSVALTAFAGACAAPPPQGATPFAPTAGMRRVLTERAAMNAKDPAELLLATARDVPGLVDAEQAIANLAGLPAPEIAVDRFAQPTASGASGGIGALLYRPGQTKNTPIIIVYPGGTWATRRAAAADEIGRQLAARTGDIVLVLLPRLAPEAQFPAIHEDAIAGYRWARSMLREWGADPTRVALAGEGPGANLALATAIAARDSGRGSPVLMPSRLVLITPWASTSTSSPSMGENGRSRPLTRATVSWSQRLYARDALADPRMDPANRATLAGLPPTTVVLAEIDPTRSGGEALAGRLRASGVPTQTRLYRGVTAEFFSLGTLVPEAAQAEMDVASDLKGAFGQPVSMSSARR